MGCSVGYFEGNDEGGVEGLLDGSEKMGDSEGIFFVGFADSSSEGVIDGTCVGCLIGYFEGNNEGELNEGELLGI